MRQPHSGHFIRRANANNANLNFTRYATFIIMSGQHHCLLKVFFCIAAFFYSISPVFCQTNLLLNGSFDDINTCKEYNAECGVEAWFYLKDVKVQITAGQPGTDVPAENAFAIFYNWIGYTNFTPVIGTILPCNLQQGKQYIFKGRMAAKLNSKLVFKPGVCIGANFYVPRRPFSTEMKPDSIMQVQHVRGTSFFEFQYTFVANGDERYLTFGTYTREDIAGANRRLFGPQSVMLTLDNFSLTSTDQLETTCAAFENNKASIYKYDHRHKDMDYTLYGKGKLPITLAEDEKDNLTRINTLPPAPVKPDTLKLGDVLFDFNKADLKAGATKMLETFFKNSEDRRTIDSIYVEGHTDSVGSDTKNVLLSQQRSQSVVTWIASNDIVDGSRIAIHPFGRSRPVATNKTAAGRALNRRVEIIAFRRQDQ